MLKPDSNRDYYKVLDVSEEASKAEIDRQYKRQAAKHHPDRGGNEEQMKSVNEAYGILKDQGLRDAYDASRRRPEPVIDFVPVSSPPSRDVGLLGHFLSAFLCLLAGLFLLLLVRFQWIWFLWPLAILAVFVIGMGVLLARSAMFAASATLPVHSRWRQHTGIMEIAFWTVTVTTGFGFVWLMTY
jgi:hypothetical protein